MLRDSPEESTVEGSRAGPATGRRARGSVKLAAPAPGPRLVPAVERAVRLLDLLAQAREPQPLAALARSAGLPKSSAHGLLGTLAALGLAERSADGDFSLGHRVLAWAGAHAAGSDLVGAFGAIAAALPALAEETVMLAVLDGSDVVYLACRPGSRPLAVNFRVGGRFPAFVTSSGKAMLATLPEERVRALVEAAGGLRRLAPRSVTSTTGLLRQLRQARAEGFAVDDEETAAGMNCFGAPVFDGRGSEAVAAVAVSLIKASTTARRRAETIAAIRDLAGQLSRRLGAPAAATALAPALSSLPPDPRRGAPPK